MQLVEILSALAAVAFTAFLVYFTARRGETASSAWMFPAALSLLFLLFSAATAAHGGAFGFWAEHTRTLWSNQVWFDLLLAIGTAWTLLLPRARELRMRPAPWLVAVCLSGCIGLLAMYARVLYLGRHPVTAAPGAART